MNAGFYCATTALLWNLVLISPAIANTSADGSDTEIKSSTPELPGRGMESAQEKITDTWITAKVKSLYVYSIEISASAINVETIDAVVILSGSVKTESVRDAAVDLARSVRGVRKVNSNDLLVHSGDIDDTDSPGH